MAPPETAETTPEPAARPPASLWRWLLRAALLAVCLLAVVVLFLPRGSSGAGTNLQNALLIRVEEGPGSGTAVVYLGQQSQQALQGDDEISQAVQQAVGSGPPQVVIRASAGVSQRDVARIAGLVRTSSGNLPIYLSLAEN